jgi:glycosyltransferase involved in cell wall biosynthesis
LYLGRITEEKGVHRAIEAAKATSTPLIIAGVSYPTEGYWHKHIEKHIDGKMIQYVGEASFKAKIAYLKNAKALLFPTQYDEVFGYAMIEAMSCGTPVIGWNKGSVSEVIANNRSGYVVDSISDMVKAIQCIDDISRQATRERVCNLFSVEKMVSGYAKVYARVIDEQRYRKQNGKQKK